MNVMKQLHNIPEEKECRLWHKYMLSTYDLLSKLDETIQDAGLYTNQVCACMWVQACMHTYVYAFVHECVYLCICVCVCMCMCVHMYVHMCVSVQLCLSFVCACLYLCVCVCMRAPMPVHSCGG